MIIDILWLEKIESFIALSAGKITGMRTEPPIGQWVLRPQSLAYFSIFFSKNNAFSNFDSIFA